MKATFAQPLDLATVQPVPTSMAPIVLLKAFRILPAGRFAPTDNRLHGRSWNLSPEQGRALASRVSQRADDYLIDYEHQSLVPGQSAPAAGWFKELEWRDDGLYVLDARWTKKAFELIACQQYRYISPVFEYDPVTMEVVQLISLALTNTPALDGLTTAMPVASLTSKAPALPAPSMSEEDREKFRWLFGPQAAWVAQEVKNGKSPLSADELANWKAVFPEVFGGQ